MIPAVAMWTARGGASATTGHYIMDEIMDEAEFMAFVERQGFRLLPFDANAEGRDRVRT